MRKRRYSSPHLSQWRSSAIPIETKRFSRLDLITLFRLARAINFIKAKIDRRELTEGITWEELIVALQEKAKGEGEDNGASWIDLLLLLFSERSFFD